ncbi:MAG: contractile injection system tape measure protein, partial [Bacteroidota bacterium]
GVMREGLSRWSSRERIAGDFSTESLEALLNLLLGDRNRFITNYLNDLWVLMDALPGRATKRQWRQRIILRFALDFAVTVSAANFNPAQFLKSLLMRFATLENQPYEALLKALVREMSSHPLSLSSGLPATLLSLLTDAGGAVTMEGAEAKAPTEQAPVPEAEPAAPEETPLPEPEEELPTDALFVANAGLVLLWPYLTRYLAQLELLQAQEFKSAKAARRAVHLLQHLVTGKQEKVPEFELVLNKVLCGLDTADPMENRIRFKKAEIELSGSLLDGVIQHWSALGNTSVEGLRNSFLMREGKLSFGEDHWLLQVEQRGWDVLLDRLPWSISRVKLPWMEHQLIVNWR